MIKDDDYKSSWKIKDATVATGLKTVTYSSDLDEILQRENIQSQILKL